MESVLNWFRNEGWRRRRIMMEGPQINAESLKYLLVYQSESRPVDWFFDNQTFCANRSSIILLCQDYIDFTDSTENIDFVLHASALACRLTTQCIQIQVSRIDIFKYG